MSAETYQLGKTPDHREIPRGKTPIIIAGLPGKMATLVAEAINQSGDFVLMITALASERRGNELTSVGNLQGIQLITPERHLEYLKHLAETGSGIVIDYSSPSAVNHNAELYVAAGIPFVMGTTGGDRQKLVETVRNSNISAVIAPNMAPHIVATQAMLESVANEFPDALSGWKLLITESHQATKKDVSGTAKGWLTIFEQLGVSLDGEIKSIRDPEEQEKLGIREKSGHGYHWFNLKSPDGNASLQISMGIEGRTPYVAGTITAVKFLEKKIKAGSRGEVFSMVDVLRAKK